MAIDVHLVERATADGQTVRNGVRMVLVAVDDAVDTTDALVRTRAETLMNANGYDLPPGYFDANREIGVGTGVWDAVGDFSVISGDIVREVIA